MHFGICPSMSHLTKFLSHVRDQRSQFYGNSGTLL